MRKTFLRMVKNVIAGAGCALVLAGVAMAAAPGKKIATVTIPPTLEQYAATPQPLTATQCAQCHSSQFGDLKAGGGNHRFACQGCHTAFHAFNPRKNNWDAIMPKCSACHDAVHGPKATDCAACHTNPHAPKKIAASSQLVTLCNDCHASVKQQLDAQPSKHTKVPCATCHTSHGFKPSCFTCHKPHTPDQPLSSCLPCHPVHQPRQITWGKDVPSSTCGSCHTKVFEKLTKSTSKHGKLACVTCHIEKHRYIPKCTDCHGLPHKQSFHDRYPNCLTCHLDVHDPPNKNLPQPAKK